jgi:HAD superfamily hydrolase (TIGR01490 family)
MNENSKKISIFDLDGTLTKSDTYLPYLIGFLKRNPKRWLKASILPFAAVMFYLKIHDNQWLKTIFLKVILGGETKDNILAWNKIFLDKLFTEGLREDIVTILKKRQNAGDIILLSTASLDIYVPDIQNWFSINHLICTNTLWQDDCLTGELDGNNCYGLEKLARVKSYMRKHNISGEVSVYSDHASDWPIMNYADKAYAVYPTKRMRAIALDNNIEIIEK